MLIRACMHFKHVHYTMIKDYYMCINKDLQIGIDCCFEPSDVVAID